jgi:hypothetical protein
LIADAEDRVSASISATSTSSTPEGFDAGVLGADVTEPVREPWVGQGVEGRRLLPTLGAFEHQHVVNLGTRLVNAGDSRDQEPGADRPRIVGVVGVEVSVKPCVEPTHSVPNERLEIPAHGVEWVGSRRRLDRPRNVPVAGADVFTLEPHPNQRIVVVGPRRPGLGTPRRSFPDRDLHTKLVVGEHTFPRRVSAQDQNEVRQIGDDIPVVVQNEIVGPIRCCLCASCAVRIPQLLLAVLLHLREAVLEDLLEDSLLETCDPRNPTTKKQPTATTGTKEKAPTSTQPNPSASNPPRTAPMMIRTF